MTKPKTRALVITIAISALLIIFNYFTLKTTSAVSAFISAEAHYSGGQKDATRQLYLLAASNETEHWDKFKAYIDKPIGDSLARVGIDNGDDKAIIKAALLRAGNHKEDLGNIIWLYHWFGNVSFMKTALAYRRQGDVLVGELYKVGNDLYEGIINGTTASGSRFATLYKLERLSENISRTEYQFTAVMTDSSRWLSALLFNANFFNYYFYFRLGRPLAMAFY